MSDELIDREWHWSYIENIEQENAKLQARIAVLETVAEAVKKLRVMTPEDMEHGKPFWVIPCDSYEPVRIAMGELEEIE
jgi:hypothetical protein